MVPLAPPEAVKVTVAEEPQTVVPPLTETASGTVLMVTVAEVPAAPHVNDELFRARANHVPDDETSFVEPEPKFVTVPEEDVCQ